MAFMILLHLSIFCANLPAIGLTAKGLARALASEQAPRLCLYQLSYGRPPHLSARARHGHENLPAFAVTNNPTVTAKFACHGGKTINATAVDSH